MNPKQVYQELASRFVAMQNCEKHANLEWEQKHRNAIQDICKNILPSGSGIDTGTKFDFDESSEDKLSFRASYHHMNEGGMYDGWTEHKIILTPSLLHGFRLHITGRNRNDIKDYLHETYEYSLTRTLECVVENGEEKYRELQTV